MAPLVGPRAAVDLALPTGIDATEVMKFNLQSGMTAEEQLRRTAAAIGTVNEEIVQAWGGLFYITEGLYSYDMQGEDARSETPKVAEFGHSDPIRGQNIGRMLPNPSFYEDALAWSKRYLERAPLSQLDTDQSLIADRWWNRVGYDLWTRILTNTENAVGASGYDVPWAIGTGTNVNYIPPQKRGQKPFANTHTHFVYQNSAASKTFATLFESQMGELRHHGYGGRLQGFVSFDDLDTIVAVSGFRELKPSDQQLIGASASISGFVTGETQGLPGELFGFYNSKKFGVLELRWDERIPTEYTFVTKSFGINNPRNGVAIRVQPGIGFGLRAEPTVNNSLVPALKIVFFQAEHSVGVNDRLNGVAGYLHSGAAAWANPTLS